VGRDEHSFNDEMALGLLQKAASLGADLDYLESETKLVRNWTEWRQMLEGYIDELQEGS